MSQVTRLTAAFQRVAQEFKNIRANDLGGMKIRKMTLVDYTLLTPKDPNTIYVVQGVIKLN